MADFEDPLSRRDNGFVPRWEIKQMIAESIDTYDKLSAGPRFVKMTDSLEEIKCVMLRIEGGMTLLKWAGALATVVGGIYKLNEMFPHL